MRPAWLIGASAVAWVVLALTVGLGVLASILVVTTFLAAITFCAVYARRHWRTPIGWNIMAMGVVIAIETALGILGTFLGSHWPLRDFIRAFAWTLVAAVLWWRVYLVAWPPPPPSDEDDGDEDDFQAAHRRDIGGTP